MGWEDKFIRSAESVPEMNRFLSGRKIDCTTKDEVFKEIFSYKWSAAIVLKNCIPEYRDMHPLRIVRLIKDNADRGIQSDEDIVQSKIDLISGVEGTGVAKNTNADLVFGAYTNEDRTVMNLITVNLEMQNTFHKSGPNTVSRAGYYAATRLVATVPAGDTEYANLHKVYSVWLCAERVVLGGMSADQICEKYKVRYLYKHRFGMRRFYDEIPGQAFGYDKEIDLMEVVMFDLKVLQGKVAEGQATDVERSLLQSLYNMSEAIEFMEKTYGVNLKGYEKGVSDSMSLLERVEEQDRRLEEKDRIIEEQGSELKEKDNKLKEKDDKLKEKDNKLREKDDKLKEKDNIIENLRRQLAGLQLS